MTPMMSLFLRVVAAVVLVIVWLLLADGAFAAPLVLEHVSAASP